MIDWHTAAWICAGFMLVLALLGWLATGMADRPTTAEDTKVPRWLFIIAVALVMLTLVSCAAGPKLEPPEPVIKTVEVKVPVPVPCPALAKLGPEPDYPDTDAAIAAAPDIFTAAKLLSAGRLMRIKRSVEYAAAKTSCLF